MSRKTLDSMELIAIVLNIIIHATLRESSLSQSHIGILCFPGKYDYYQQDHYGLLRIIYGLIAISVGVSTECPIGVNFVTVWFRTGLNRQLITISKCAFMNNRTVTQSVAQSVNM